MRAALRETIAKILAGTCIALLAAVLTFRAFFYSRMYLEPAHLFESEAGMRAALINALVASMNPSGARPD